MGTAHAADWVIFLSGTDWLWGTVMVWDDGFFTAVYGVFNVCFVSVANGNSWIDWCH